MWLLCCGMMRSGSTLQYNIAVKVAERGAKVRQIGFVQPHQYQQLFNSALEDDGTWFIAKFHEYPPELEAFRQRVNPKAVYIYRDIRDVTVSLMNMFGWRFDSIELDTFVHVILQQYEAWTQFPNISISRYEAVMAAGGLLAEVNKIANYMEVDLSPSEAERIADSVSLSAQQRYIEQFDFVRRGEIEMNSYHDPNTLLHDRHIHSGTSDQWKTALTSEQIAIVEAWAGEWLEARGYPVTPRSAGEWERLFQNVVRNHSMSINALSVALTASSQELEHCKASMEQLRARKIVRVMEKLGRPII